MDTLGRLKYRFRSDRGFRANVVQTLVLVTVLSAAGFALHNLAANLANLGKDFSFAFLLAPASYDITFSPFLEYTSRDTHLKAALVGLLNTVLVAATGIVTATVLGFVMGIARLSGNWLVNRSVYVVLDFVRNVPLLLHILWIHGFIVSVLPAPKQAIGVGGVAFISNRGVYLPAPHLEPGAWAVAGVALVGVAGAIAIGGWARTRQHWTGKRIRTGLWIPLAMLVPVGLALAATGSPIGWEVPELAGFNFTGGLGIKPEFLALWAALSGYTACFIAEAVRGGLEAVGRGQTEAGLALGIRPLSTLRLIVIPQAARIMLPPIVNQYLNLTKDSSLAIAIGYMDVVATIGGISLMQTGREVETMMIVLGVYLLLSVLIALSLSRFHRTSATRAGRTVGKRDRRPHSVRLEYDEAVAVREVAMRRIRPDALAQVWEACEQACEGGAKSTLKLAWREAGRWRERTLSSRDEFADLDLSRALFVHFDGIEVIGATNRIRIRERPPTSLLEVVSARANQVEIDVRGDRIEPCLEIALGIARVCQRVAGTPAVWRWLRAGWSPALVASTTWLIHARLSDAYSLNLGREEAWGVTDLTVLLMSVGCGILTAGLVVTTMLTSGHVRYLTQYLRVVPRRDWGEIARAWVVARQGRGEERTARSRLKR